MTTPTLYEGAMLNEQATHALIRGWEVYLRARLTLLIPDDPLSAAFERDAQVAARTDAEQDLAAIPSEVRTLFGQAVTLRQAQHRARLETEQRLADPDQVDRLALQELLAEATEPDETGHILVPTQGDQGGVDWLEFRAADLASRPDERSYRAAQRGAADRERRTRILAGVGALLLTAVAIWMLVRPDDSTATAASGATANGTPVQPWRATTLTLVAESEATWPLLPVSPVSDWPSDGQAHLRDGASLPMQACAPSDTLTSVRTVRIAGDGSTPDRTYTIVAADPPSMPDLVLVSCADPAIHVTGMLQPLTPPTLAEVGETQRLGEQDVTLGTVTIAGAADTPEVPQGAARVILTLTASSSIDWAASAPTLRVGDGTEQSAPEVRPLEGGVSELRFLITASGERLPAELRLRDTATGQVMRWALAIDPPPDRLQVLHAALVTVGVAPAGDGTLAAMLTNQGAQPLTLTTADFSLEWQGARMALAAIEGIDTPLAPGETRTVTLTLPPDLPEGATLSIGAALFRMTH